MVNCYRTETLLTHEQAMWLQGLETQVIARHTFGWLHNYKERLVMKYGMFSM